MIHKTDNVFLYIPNIIGYFRVALCGVSLYYLPTEPMIAMFFYIVSCLLDAVDGNAARYFDQCASYRFDQGYTITRVLFLGTVP